MAGMAILKGQDMSPCALGSPWMPWGGEMLGGVLNIEMGERGGVAMGEQREKEVVLPLPPNN